MGLIGWIFKRLVVLAVLLGIALFFLQNHIVKLSTGAILRAKSNARMTIGHVDSKLQKGFLRLEGVTILNPVGFQENKFMEINFVQVEFDIVRLLKQEKHLKSLFVDIQRIYIVKQKKEGINIVEIQNKSGSKSSYGKQDAGLSVEDLRVRIGDVVYKDYTRRPPKMSRIFLGLEQRYENVNSLKSIVDSILTQKVLKATAY